jgi:hypothetical protein
VELVTSGTPLLSLTSPIAVHVNAG